MGLSRTRCPSCKGKMELGERIHPGCIDAFAKEREAKAERAQAKNVKAAAKIEREEIKARKERLKRIPDYIKEAQVAFNAYVRARDAGKPCICCGMPLELGGVGGGFDCGHYRSTGSASHLRFNPDNAHGQRKVCNRWGAGRAVDYRLGLISRIGLERVEALESDNQPRKWLKEDLLHIRDTYRQKLKEFKKTG